MSDGFVAFKALGWGAAALLAAAAVMPNSSDSQWNPLRKLSRTSELQRPSLLKKNASATTTTTTTTTSTSSTTTAPVMPELSSVPSNFDVMSELVPYDMPGSSAPDFGAFRFMCMPGQVLRNFCLNRLK